MILNVTLRVAPTRVRVLAPWRYADRAKRLTAPHPTRPLRPRPADDLELALRLADTADAITLDRFRAADLRVTRKPDRTPVTDADTATEDALRAVIGTERPGRRRAGRGARR